jgi:hypothetical protein
MATDRDDEDEEDLQDVEVERMPNLDGWEFFKAIDGGSERFTVAFAHAPDRGKIEYAFWTDIKADPAATGVLDVHDEPDKVWAKSVRKAMRKDSGLDTEARADVLLAILRRHDPTLHDYEERLLFSLDPPSDEEEDDDDDAEDDE